MQRWKLRKYFKLLFNWKLKDTGIIGKGDIPEISMYKIIERLEVDGYSEEEYETIEEFVIDKYGREAFAFLYQILQ